MLKLIKWDLMNYIKVQYRLFVVFAIPILIAAIVPDQTGFVISFINTIGLLTATAFFLYSWFSAIKELTAWMRRSSIQLELTQGSSPYQRLISKLLLSSLIAGAGTVLTVFIMKYIVKYNGVIQITEYNLEKVLKLLLGMLTFFIIILFSSLISNMISFTRKRHGLTSFLFAALIYLLLGFLIIVFYGFVGAWDISIFKHSNEIILASNYTHRGIETLCYYASSIIICVLGFFGSCFLLEHKFEFDQTKGD